MEIRRFLARAALAVCVALYAPVSFGEDPTAVAPDLTAPAPTATDAETPPATVRYGEHIRPILSDHCFECHGPDPSTRKADLRLDLREAAIADLGGYAAVVPGDPDASELLLRVTDHGDDRMPPVSSARRALTTAELARIRTWIEQGAEYETHWAWIPPVRAEVPATPEDIEATNLRSRNRIDAFIRAEFARHGITPSPAAAPEALLRRLFLDVTGLPPTPEELATFLADTRPDSYERTVDRLLTEEPYRSRFAEHWASSWLDAARYGDTCGIHTDAGRQIWLWRDWVLAALRDDLPYDRFIVEQIAGDLLPDATVAQKIASGFNRNHVTTDEGGVIAAEALVEYAVDRVDTTAAVFLGLTAGCARCHDHKYDPITQEEYYQLFAFFDSIEEPGLYSQLPNPNRAFEPFIEVPTEEQEETLAALAARATALEAEMAAVPPEEEAERLAFAEESRNRAGIAWTTPTVVSARSTEPGVVLTVQDDRSVIASGKHPAHEDYELVLRTDAVDSRLVLLESLVTPGGGTSVGRASHHNAVISKITLAARPADTDDTADSDDAWTDVPLRWAWADHTQTNLDYTVTNVLRDDENLGWAPAGHQVAGGRLLALLADAPFGVEGGTELRAKIEFRSPYQQHSIGRVRVRLSPLSDAGIAMLPVSLGRWHIAGHYKSTKRDLAFDETFGPETLTAVTTAPFAEGRKFRFDGSLVDGAVVRLKGGIGSNYLGRTIYSPDARSLDLSLGSDDAYRLFVNGVEVAKERVDRGAAPDQARVTVPLVPGRNSLILKIVNTGGPTAAYFRADPAEGVLPEGIVAALMPPEALDEIQRERYEADYRRRVSPTYREAELALAAVREEEAAIRDAVPRTMVMQDREMPRETFVLERGQYDHPDRDRPVEPDVPAVLGRLPADAPRNRLGLAEWMVAPENPLVARVAVNRVWQNVFGTGLVRTAEDFGLQGEWPSHPALLDRLAVEFREGGWSVRSLLRLILTSATYRQDSRVRPELLDIDPENRLLARYPRRRLSAEQIRDQALYTSGLLVEEFGGPSVKPYQPEGLWREVAMPQSNTRNFARGDGEELWRRSLYTYWKRAAPPPSLVTFDAPVREACVIRRPITNTPLQALVLWNDEQFVEAARVLAERTLLEETEDAARLEILFLRCTGRSPEGSERTLLADALADFRTRYAAAPDDAAALIAVGEAPRDTTIAPAELAAWTMLASAVLNLHETITQD